MTNRKTTKRALLTSVTALALCVVMLVGTTFAWFTDTAKTNVNKIQAGNLDVGLQMLVTENEENEESVWKDAEGETLEWVKSEDAPTNEAILWEPGCTYSLPQLRVVNYGNLALKYEIKITGTQGDAKLLEALEFSVNNAPFNSADGAYIGTLAAGSKENPTASAGLTITGHMKEEANNDYQNLSLDGIAITVYATQEAAEFDSYDNRYDVGAFDALKALYPVSKSAAVTKDADGNKQEVTINDADATGAAKTFEVTVPAEAMADETDNISVTISKAASADTAKFTVTDGNKLEQFDVTVTGIKGGNTADIEVQLFIGKGYTFTGNVPVKHLKSDGNVEDINGTYDTSTGFVSFKTKSFSPFAVEVPEMAAAIGTGHDVTYYSTLSAAVDAAQDGDTITLVKDSVGGGLMLIAEGAKTITIDFNGHTYAVNQLVGSGSTVNQAAHFEKGNAVTLKNGTLKVADSAASSAKILVQNYCNLTASNMTFDGTNLMLMSQQPVTLSNNGNTSVFEKCTVIAANRDNSIAIDSSVWGSYTDTDVTLKNCTVYGDLDISEYKLENGTYVKAEGVAKNENNQPCITVIDGAYTDLADAVLYAKDGATITLAADASGSGIGSLDGSKTTDRRSSLTIDFAGHTYTMLNPAVGSKDTETQAMHWGTSLASVTMKNGTFKVAEDATEVAMAMQNYITFTAENMVFDFTEISVAHYGENEFSGKYAIFNGKECSMFNNNGADTQMKLTNCTVNLPEESNFGGAVSGTLTLNNTNFNGYLCFNDIDGKIIVGEGSTIKGGEVKAYFDTLTINNNSGTWTAENKA